MKQMIIRNMTASDLDFACELTASENWLTETRQSFENFLTHDPKGCFIAWSGTRRIGMCVGVGYRDFGFLAELIVVKSHRGRGIGSGLIAHTIDYLKQCDVSSIYLHGDVEAVSLYERFGFRRICRSMSFIGKPADAEVTDARPMSNSDLEIVLEMDRKRFGADRGVFLNRNFEVYPHLCQILEDHAGIGGYLFGRQGNGVIAAGPCGIREQGSHLRGLFSHLCSRARGDRIRIDILESHRTALEIMRSFPFMKEKGFTWRMVLGTDKVRGYPERLYAVGSPATG